MTLIFSKKSPNLSIEAFVKVGDLCPGFTPVCNSCVGRLKDYQQI
jgi:hypothetical protein